MTVLRVTQPFAVTADTGALHVFRFGDLVDATDPLVAGREALCEPVEDTVARHANAVGVVFPMPDDDVVEDASAEPGVKRTTRRRKKD